MSVRDENNDGHTAGGHGGFSTGGVTPIRRSRPGPEIASPYNGGLITGPDEASVRSVIEAMERGEEKRARWPAEGREAMSALAALFPSMRDVPGTDPWDVDQLIDWCKSGAPTSGSGWAARFLLSVWNPGTNWNEYGLPGAGRFEVMEAWSCWDDAHRAAAMKWLDAPFWP